MDHQLLRERFADPSDVTEQHRTGGVELDADMVDAALDHIAELLRQQRLVNVVLVLTDADRLRLDLDELREGILESSRDRDRTSDRQIELRKLFTRDIR